MRNIYSAGGLSTIRQLIILFAAFASLPRSNSLSNTYTKITNMNTNLQLKNKNAIDSSELEALSAERRLVLLHQIYGDQLVASTSFGIQSSIMLHLISRYTPDVPVIFIDTGYLFPETYHYAEKLTNRLNINLKTYTPKYSAARINALWGELWKQGEVGENRYAHITKIEPMNQALSDLNANLWMSGIRRNQSQSRTNKPFIEQQNQISKAYPILDWSDKQIAEYQIEHKLPLHPLADKGYVTSGDVHSTKPLQDVDNAEETRFNGGKYECGLHLDSNDDSLVL